MTDSFADRASLLRASLRANAAFSALSGLTFALAGGAVAGFLGVEPPLLVTVVGINLLGFAAALVYVASRPVPDVRLAKVIIGLDLAWVVGTVVLVFADVFSAAGTTAVVVIANVVLAFAVVQSIGVRRLAAVAVVA